MKFTFLLGICIIAHLLHPAIVRSQGTPNSDHPKLRKIAFPIYPVKARAAGIAGDVIIKLTIDSKGGIVSHGTLTGHRLLAQAVEEVLPKMSFDLGRGKREVVMTFTFSIIPRGIEPKVRSHVMFEVPNKVTIFEFAVESSAGIPTEPHRPQ